MSKKPASQYSCNKCSAVSTKWAGQCSACGEWNCIEQKAVASTPSRRGYTGYTGELAPLHNINEVAFSSCQRMTTGMKELDRVLGGGLVPGSVVLLGGDPGVGKSTALLQVCCNLSQDHKTIYISGEESLQQIAMRSRRVGLPDDKLLLMAETQVEKICATAAQEKPEIMVIDSIQTMQVEDVQSAPGSVSQVREAAAQLTQFAKMTGTAIFLVGHVTKSGDLAGPRVLEHIIDVVCYIEAGRDSRFRLIRAVKNRHGAVNELGVFAMTEKGLKEVSNPSAIFLSRETETMPGSTVMVPWEGTRPLLVEIQALVDESYAEIPKRVSLGLEQNRLAMLLAVLHRHGKIATYKHDVFVNVVGGVRVSETSADLALLLAVVSSLKDKKMDRDLVVFGEVGLAGELRPVTNGQERLREAAKHGFKQAIIPKANVTDSRVKGLEVFGARNLAEALAIV